MSDHSSDLGSNPTLEKFTPPCIANPTLSLNTPTPPWQANPSVKISYHSTPQTIFIIFKQMIYARQLILTEDIQPSKTDFIGLKEL